MQIHFYYACNLLSFFDKFLSSNQSFALANHCVAISPENAMFNFHCKQKKPFKRLLFKFGTLKGNRTPDFAVRGRCISRFTMRASTNILALLSKKINTFFNSTPKLSCPCYCDWNLCPMANRDCLSKFFVLWDSAHSTPRQTNNLL